MQDGEKEGQARRILRERIQRTDEHSDDYREAVLIGFVEREVDNRLNSGLEVLGGADASES